MRNNYVLIITLHADPAMAPGYDEWGGTHTYMKELLDEFTKHKQQCIMITRLSMRYLPHHEIYSDYCQIYRLQNGDGEPMSKLKLCEYHEHNIEQIQAIIGEQPQLPQIIHSVYWNSGRVAMELSELYGIPFVHSVISNARGRVFRGAQDDLPQRATYEQRIYDAAKEILCVSEDEKQDLIKFYNVPENKIIVAGQYVADSFVYPAHDANNFPRINSHSAIQHRLELGDTYNQIFKSPSDCSSFWLYKAFTYFGRMDFNKGLSVIIRAWYMLYQKYTIHCPPLWLVGGSLTDINLIRKDIQNTIHELEELEETGKIVWWGYLDFQGLSTVLLKTLVVVMHSLYEPGGRVAVEAMSEQVPVIATPNGFAKDIIRDWENGFLVNYGDTVTLARRMEHFLRQPLLSNSLGKQASKSAQEIIKHWSFTERHFNSYGISMKETNNILSTISENNSHYDYDFERRVKLYPYFSMPVSTKYITAFLEKHLGHAVSVDFSYKSDGATSSINRLISENGNYIAKHYYTRMAVSPLLNPLFKTAHGRHAHEFFEQEVYMYNRLKNDVLVTFDELHHVLFLRELKEPQIFDEKYLYSCLEYLIKNFDYLTNEEKENAALIFNQNPASIQEIESQLTSLQNMFPNFYFECSGFFSPNLCWKISQHLIEYNKFAFSHDETKYLYRIHSLFKDITFPLTAELFRIINLEAECKHILKGPKGLVMIDYEKASLGPVEAALAVFLYDYIKRTKNNFSFRRFFVELRNNSVVQNVDLKMLISLLAYRSFYNYIYNKVIHLNDLQNDIEFLKNMEEIYYEYIDICTTPR